MTVAAKGPTAFVGIHPDEADRLFTEVYREYWPRLTRFIQTRLDGQHFHTAEDLAQEAMIAFWRGTISKNKLGNRDTVFGLLACIGRSVIVAFYEKRVSTERVLDFADPMNGPVVVSGGTGYALGSPDLAPLCREIDAAMEAMAAASKRWRDQHKRCYKLQLLAANAYHGATGGITDATKERLQADHAESVRLEESQLSEFREACLRVGRLRAEMEAAAGPRWRSASGGPVAPWEREKVPGSLSGDLSVTHCPAGHLMDRHNTAFSETGARKCRACNAKQMREWWDKNPRADYRGRQNSKAKAAELAEAAR